MISNNYGKTIKKFKSYAKIISFTMPQLVFYTNLKKFPNFIKRKKTAKTTENT